MALHTGDILGEGASTNVGQGRGRQSDFLPEMITLLSRQQYMVVANRAEGGTRWHNWAALRGWVRSAVTRLLMWRITRVWVRHNL
jgi:hypothetical protein